MPINWAYQHKDSMDVHLEHCKQDDINLSMYRLYINDFILTPEEALRLLEILQAQQESLEVADAQNKKQQAAEAKKPKEEQHFICVEYDEDFTGGDYDEVGTNVYIPVPLYIEYGMDRAFKMHTGINSIHIIHYTENDYISEDEIEEDDEEEEDEPDEL